MKGSGTARHAQLNSGTPTLRITNQMILSRSLDSVQRGQQEAARLQRQIVTGRKFERLSDAPLDARS
ncbi:MAG: hypothetical protein KJO65_08585, partial [Gemmatimonadetes bacterium]|nr:hypothetical protein [Gemmatimonadota bacterium]